MPTVSMEPTVKRGSKVIVQMYLLSEPKRNDLIVFDTEGIKFEGNQLGGSVFLKRLIGLPGEKLLFKDNKIYINDKEYITDLEYILPKDNQALINHNEPEVTIPKDSYFVLGDNSKNSLDSRYYGFVPIENVIYKSIYIIQNKTP